jgi:hypothetical protein
MSDLDKIDPNFIADLRDSREAVEVAAKWLAKLGYAVVIRPTFERPDPSQRHAFADQGDLEILARVEVKRRRALTFKDKSDFPYSTLIVDACHKFDRAKPKPWQYVILNREMSAAFLVDSRTHPQWKRVSKYDPHAGRAQDFYECPLELVEWVRIDR